VKIFILVVIAATVIGGLIGGEITDQTFTVWGAAFGGVGTFSILMGLGAFFTHQEKKKDKAANLTPEMRAVFARMAERHAAKSSSPKGKLPAERPPERFSIEAAVQGLIDQDLETLAAGKIPERRLIPHHAIKRDVILKAFEVDFQKLSASMQELNNEHFQSQIDGIKRLDQHDLDRVIATMKEQRTDLAELERQVRAKNPMYSIVDPLF
jgi:hypothetical protein